jgi:predicted Fe-Mo cluster-binding NifX family protein
MTNTKGDGRMKVVFTTSGNDLNAQLDARFGRAPKFLLYDLDAGSFEVIDNDDNVQMSHGAGVQSAGMVARLAPSAIVTGHCGPKAFHVLSAAGIKIYTSDAATVGEALEQYRSGKLTEALASDVGGHWA